VRAEGEVVAVGVTEVAEVAGMEEVEVEGMEVEGWGAQGKGAVEERVMDWGG
jgi:hypothetical protein